MLYFCLNVTLTRAIPNEWSIQPINAKVWINSLPYNSNKTLVYFEMLNCKHVIFGNSISGLTLYTKLKLKSHKVNKSKWKSQWLTLQFHYSLLWFTYEVNGCDPKNWFFGGFPMHNKYFLFVFWICLNYHTCNVRSN